MIVLRSKSFRLWVVIAFENSFRRLVGSSKEPGIAPLRLLCVLFLGPISLPSIGAGDPATGLTSYLDGVGCSM